MAVSFFRHFDLNLGRHLWDARSQFKDIVLICQGGTVEAHKFVLWANCEFLRSKLKASTTKLKFTFPANHRDLLKVLEFVYCGEVVIFNKDKDRISEIAIALGVRGWPHLALPANPDSSLGEFITRQPTEPVQVSLQGPESEPKLNLNGCSGTCSSSEATETRTQELVQKRELLFEVEDRKVPKKKVRFLTDEASSNHGLADCCSRTEATGLTLDQFPDELLVLIFSFVPTYDLLRNVAPVSRRFERLARDQSAHIRITLPFDLDMRGASLFLMQMKKIESLEIFTPKDQIHLQSTQGLTTSARAINDRRYRLCDSIILSISSHPNLKSVIVEGMKLTADTFAYLGDSNFFKNLEVLSISLDQNYAHRRAAIDCSGAGIKHLADVGKLTHLRLKGIENVRPDHLVDLAAACPNLQMLETDAALKKESINLILEKRCGTLKYLKSLKPLHLCGDDNLKILSQCTKMVSLLDYGVPFYEGLIGKPDLKSLFITVTHRSELELMQKAIKTSTFSNVTSLNLYTSRNEFDIYPFLSVGFPNLTKLFLYVHNIGGTPDVFTKAIVGLDKLTAFGIQAKVGGGHDFDISEVFIKGSCKNLKMIYFDLGSNKRLQAKKLFRKLPGLELTITKSRCFVKPDSTIKSMMPYLRSMNDEQMSIVVLDDVNDDAVVFNEFI